MLILLTSLLLAFLLLKLLAPCIYSLLFDRDRWDALCEIIKDADSFEVEDVIHRESYVTAMFTNHKYRVFANVVDIFDMNGENERWFTVFDKDSNEFILESSTESSILCKGVYEELKHKYDRYVKELKARQLEYEHDQEVAKQILEKR